MIQAFMHRDFSHPRLAREHWLWAVAVLFCCVAPFLWTSQRCAIADEPPEPAGSSTPTEAGKLAAPPRMDAAAIAALQPRYALEENDTLKYVSPSEFPDARADFYRRRNARIPDVVVFEAREGALVNTGIIMGPPTFSTISQQWWSVASMS